MTRYYHNENPQVTLWRELAVKSQKAAMESQEIAREAIQDKDKYKELLYWSNKKMDEYKEAWEEANSFIAEANATAKSCNDNMDGYISLMRKFNSLPWYRKIFYKFKL